MKLELIIHYDNHQTKNDIDKTLHSLTKYNILPDAIKLSVNPPREILYSEFVDLIQSTFPKQNIECYLQMLSSYNFETREKINKSAEVSQNDYYIFVNAGYEFVDNEVFNGIRNGVIIFADPVDDQYNEFACNLKLHKQLGGFGKEHTLIEKIEYKLKMLEEAKNAATKLAEGGSDNL